MSNMNGQKTSKINRLLHTWLRGTIATNKFLNSLGVTRQLASAYCKSNWIESIGKGAFKIVGDNVDWTGGLYALLYELKYKIHVAANSSLELQGYGHYIPLGESQSIWLYRHNDEMRNLPLWFIKSFSKTNDIDYTKRNIFTDDDLEIIEIPVKNYNIKVSSPERALLESIELTPQFINCEYVLHLIEGMTTLRPKVLEKLLVNCNSVKTKRMFLLLAESQDHEWLKRISLKNVNLGHGKRVIGSGGYYYKKYKISLPINLKMKEGNLPDA